MATSTLHVTAAFWLALTLWVSADVRADTRAAQASLYEPGLHWTDDSGRQTSLAEFAGHRTILTMAYATCRRTCSFTLKKLVAMQHEADRRHESLDFVVVSFDPVNDNAAAWRTYRQNHHLDRANWHFLTGDLAHTRRLAQRIGIGDYWTYDEHVMHDVGVVLLDAEGKVEKRLGWHDLS